MAFDINTAKPAGGFDPSTARPEGQPPPEQPKGDDGVIDVLTELASSANRSVTEFVDFLGPNAVNSILQLSGSEKRVPTLTQTLDEKFTIGRPGAMDPGVPRDIVQAMGNTATLGAGMVQVPRNLAKAGGVAAEMLGFGSAKAPVKVAADAATQLAIRNGDVAGAKVMVNQAGDIVSDDIAKESIRQGFDEGFVSMLKSSPAQARQKMLAMLDIVEKGKKNFYHQGTNRPLDVIGDSVLDRVKVVWQANRMAARSLDNVASGLKGRAVDHRSAVESFVQDLDSMGIGVDPKAGKLNFDGSDIEGLKGPQRIINNIFDRMRNTRTPDAYDVHRLKRFIDHQVSYGKSKKGLDGKVEGILKGLRHNLDETLDNTFPEYNRVNTQYAETRGAIDALQDVAGSKMDLMGENANKALGTLSRRILSNAQSRVPLIDSISLLDDTARKYGAPKKFATTSGRTDIVPFDDIMRPIVPDGVIRKRSGVSADVFNDDIVRQAMFADQLDAMFGTHAKTSLQGDTAKVVDRAAAGLASGRDTGLVEEGVKWGLDKVRGINEENALKAMRELLQRDM